MEFKQSKRLQRKGHKAKIRKARGLKRVKIRGRKRWVTVTKKAAAAPSA